MKANGLLMEIAWPRLPSGIATPGELADRLDADLRDRARVAAFDEHGLWVRVHQPHQVEALAAELAYKLSQVGAPDQTFLSWHDELGDHRRSLSGRRIGMHRKVA
ncbi:hypothetical protein CcI156_18100 [Frankia sp. CcI156]|jgi:hypothetical protein|uniref:Uncharacterized protein n=1 Tax=Frankia casuarinae (strain DSM 45818 / CECT 9043 / HFP020203 / CcI3) TaxID=106370 RepID=Q2JE75_FRACC|nr:MULTISPECIES: hypothetical protein [Frankia]ABD10417.1 hypothetical protein Francci3_1035 [Frankia casuarinae]ETA00784.1 hypothetical protein CcI6DRAFT_03818 [Frankia sp. CcI6]EYT90608.1 hypothetical protein ThrDRAFT_03766 [Frankia casuarinae]KDA41398.1 hypothetical protein BMG523Draft_03771 [Frankia sp. BMG5.23]KEZ34906.1 hypothetical protein CEDDRAFT_03720 [Frankia sp. CeD]